MVAEDIPALDLALVDAQRCFERPDAEGDRSRFDLAYATWQEGWVRYTPHLGDDELERRYQSVGAALIQLAMEGEDSSAGIGQLVAIAVRAIINARLALAYARRRDSLPPKSFPDSDDLILLTGAGGTTPFARDAPLQHWLNEHPEPPWRPLGPPAR